ncbi:unnamed protein product [Lampetra planeri]
MIPSVPLVEHRSSSRCVSGGHAWARFDILHVKRRSASSRRRRWAAFGDAIDVVSCVTLGVAIGGFLPLLKQDVVVAAAAAGTANAATWQRLWLRPRGSPPPHSRGKPIALGRRTSRAVRRPESPVTSARDVMNSPPAAAQLRPSIGLRDSPEVFFLEIPSAQSCTKRHPSPEKHNRTRGTISRENATMHNADRSSAVKPSAVDLDRTRPRSSASRGGGGGGAVISLALGSCRRRCTVCDRHFLGDVHESDGFACPQIVRARARKPTRRRAAFTSTCPGTRFADPKEPNTRNRRTIVPNIRYPGTMEPGSLLPLRWSPRAPTHAHALAGSERMGRAGRVLARSGGERARFAPRRKMSSRDTAGAAERRGLDRI